MPSGSYNISAGQGYSPEYIDFLVEGMDVVVETFTSIQNDPADASISGTVVDSTGAAISGIEVIVYNSNADISYTATTGSAGGYQITNLKSATYDVYINDMNIMSEPSMHTIVLSVSEQAIDVDFKVTDSMTSE
jgi:hypothetical protein